MRFGQLLKTHFKRPAFYFCFAFLLSALNTRFYFDYLEEKGTVIQWVVLNIFYLSNWVNLGLLIYIFMPFVNGEKFGFKNVVLLLLKGLLVLATFAISIQILRDRVLILLILYIAQLSIFIMHLKSGRKVNL